MWPRGWPSAPTGPRWVEAEPGVLVPRGTPDPPRQGPAVLHPMVGGRGLRLDWPQVRAEATQARSLHTSRGSLTTYRQPGTGHAGNSAAQRRARPPVGALMPPLLGGHRGGAGLSVGDDLAQGHVGAELMAHGGFQVGAAAAALGSSWFRREDPCQARSASRRHDRAARRARQTALRSPGHGRRRGWTAARRRRGRRGPPAPARPVPEHQLDRRGCFLVGVGGEDLWQQAWRHCRL